MENKDNTRTNWVPFEEGDGEAEDTLSFCNLDMQDYKDSSVAQSPRRSSSSAQDFFEFFRDDDHHQNPEFSSSTDVVFCGKLLMMHEDHELNEYQKRDYLALVRSRSFRPSSRDHEYNPFYNDEKDIANGSFSRRMLSSSSSSNYRTVQKVNISGLTSMSKKSRRRMFMFGPVKFKPEMELSAIKERQGRRRSTATTMFPSTALVAADSRKAVVSGGGKAAGGGGDHLEGKRSYSCKWNAVRASMQGRVHLSSVLARSFGGCIPSANSANIVGKYVPVAN